MTDRERVDLETFLAGLSEESAAEARAAAARIDDLARTGNALEGVERRFMPAAMISGLAFLVGIYLFLVPGTAPRLVTIACLAALPLTALFYTIRVRPRTAADRDAEHLNVQYFLPNGGLYFAAGPGPACVVRVPSQTHVLAPAKITKKDIWW